MYVSEHEIHKGRTIASIYFFMQGLASLIPINTIISTLDFYTDRFPTASPSFTFPLACFTSNVILILIMVYIKKNFSLNFRVPFSLFVMTLLLLGMPIIAVNMPHSLTGLWIILGFQFVSGAFNTISNATVVGLAGHFPSHYIAKNSTGASVSGLLSNILRGVLLIFFPYGTSETHSIYEILIYYITAAVALMICIILHYKFIYSDYAAITLPLDNLPPSKRPDELSESRLTIILDDQQHVVAVSMTAWENAIDNFQELWRVLKHLKMLLFIMVINNTISASMYPGVMLKKPVTYLDPAWKIVVFAGVFNLFNSLGKFSTIFKGLVCKTVLGMVTGLRLIFLFTFVIEATTLHFPVIDTEWFFYINVALFALTDGFVTSSVFILCPTKVHGHDKEIAGFLSLQGLLFGFTIGTYCALLFRNL